MAGPKREELDLMLKMAWKVPGLYGRQEAEFLYTLARRKGNLVEIGCWRGRTTIILLMAAGIWGAKVTSIDPFGKERMPKRYAKLEATAEKWIDGLTRVGLQPGTLLAMISDEARQHYDKEISLLFIDSDHSYKQVKQDLSNWTPLIKVGGYLVLHDMWFPSLKGLASAIVEWWKPEVWRFLGQVEWTVAFERIK